MRSLIVLLIVVTTPLVAAADEQWIGKRVFYKPGAVAMVGTTNVNIETIPFPATVGDVNAGWLWLGRAWVRVPEVMLTKEALKYFNEQIKREPKNASAWASRGSVWREKGDLENAINDYTEAVRLDPHNISAYINRGDTWRRKGESDNALSDYDEVIRLDHKNAAVYYKRAVVWKSKGEFDSALNDYTEAVRLDPQLHHAYNGIAWLRATCLDDQYRDGKKAVEYATKACELTRWKSGANLDTLAAAYAEAGDFTNAVEWQEKSLELTPAHEKKVASERLELYREHVPYRDVPKKSVELTTHDVR